MRKEHFSTPGVIELHCAVTTGTISVRTGDELEATVTLDGEPKVTDAVRVELIGDRLVITEPRSSFFELITRGDHRLDITARVPHGSSVRTKTASGDAELDGDFGALHMQTASGDLRARGTVSGDVDMKSASGDVQLGRVHGDVSIQTVSGDLRAEAIDGSAIVNGVSGDVSIGAPRAGTVTVRNVSGDVTLGIEPGSAVDLDVESASGDLRSDVPLDGEPHDPEAPTVVIRGATASGDIRIVRAVTAATRGI